MNIPKDLHYTASHEWVRVKGNTATVGLTDFAQHQLSDLTFVELPEKGDVVSASDEVAVVESVKGASDVYTPVSGTILEANARVVSEPETINADPYGDGWLFKITLSAPEEIQDLLDADQYEEKLPEEE
jgi:glycine cleavage system H protein